ncbi:MAG: glycosyltransferase family 2 protein [Sphingobacteriales bacterium]|nr:MAG: glycosyltransferase family 2 protein [Sphingobacteriales bacterium]
MDNDPAVFFSVIVPTYNRAKLIGDTLQSLLSQTYAGFEILVIDDGSTDNTKEVMERWVKRDDRVKYFVKQNGERGAARNYGIERAQGTYITFIDSDDLAYTGHLQYAYEYLKQKSWPECYAQAYEIKEKASGKVLVHAKHIAADTANEELLKGNFLSCIGVFVKKEVLQDLRFEEDRNFAGTEDWLLWLQLSARYPIFFSNTVTASMLEHDTRSVLSFPEDKLVYRAEHLKKKLTEDEVFSAEYGKDAINALYAHMLTYTSLHLAMSGKKRSALRYLLKAARTDFKEIQSRRTLAIIKKVTIG